MISSRIEVEGISKTYRALGRHDVRALLDLSFSAPPGRVLGFLGPNGAGKSTAMRIIVGLLRSDTGTVRLSGLQHDDVFARRKLGFLPESFRCYSRLTAREVLSFHAELLGLMDSQLKAEVERVASLVEMSHSLDRRVSGFSRGMLQRLGLAQALLDEPEILVLDEPTSGLDPDGRVLFSQTVLHERNRGATILFCTHSLDDVHRICDDILILAHGTALFLGSLATALDSIGDSCRIEFQAPAEQAYSLRFDGATSVSLNAVGNWFVDCSAARKQAVLRQLLESNLEIVSVASDSNRLVTFYQRVLRGASA